MALERQLKRRCLFTQKLICDPTNIRESPSYDVPSLIFRRYLNNSSSSFQFNWKISSWSWNARLCLIDRRQSTELPSLKKYSARQTSDICANIQSEQCLSKKRISVAFDAHCTATARLNQSEILMMMIGAKLPSSSDRRDYRLAQGRGRNAYNYPIDQRRRKCAAIRCDKSTSASAVTPKAICFTKTLSFSVARAGNICED